MSYVKTAYDIARKTVFFCLPDEKIKEIARQMHTNNIGSILVCSGKGVDGIITVNDMLRQVARNVDSDKVLAKDIMSSPVRKVNKDLEIDELVEEFNRHKVSRMVLVDDKDNVVGVVRDIAVYKYFTFFKYDDQVRQKFASEYLRKLY
jgi:predicted transcriptional regulator